MEPGTQAYLLYIEDDPDCVLLLELAFQKAGIDYPLKVLSDGEEAVKFLGQAARDSDHNRNALPKAILLDIKLPKKNGFEILEWFRKQPLGKSLPVIMLTSSLHPMDKEKAHQLAVDDYLIRPPDLDEFVRMVKTIHDRWLLPPQA